jgi:recombination protein RecA
MSKALRKITGNLSRSKCSIIFINQLRDKMSLGFGPAGGETTSGGRALKFYSSIRVDVRRTETLKKNAIPYGHRLQLKIVKNKVAPPFKVANVVLIYGEGISQMHNVIDLAVEHGIITKAGSWYDYDGSRIGQGIDNVKAYFSEHPEIFEVLEQSVRQKIFNKEK